MTSGIHTLSSIVVYRGKRKWQKMHIQIIFLPFQVNIHSNHDWKDFNLKSPSFSVNDDWSIDMIDDSAFLHRAPNVQKSANFLGLIGTLTFGGIWTHRTFYSILGPNWRKLWPQILITYFYKPILVSNSGKLTQTFGRRQKGGDEQR